ncbi:nitrite/sulfite reductase [Kribbella alba]|uniref:Nitrite/sulfite reductase n=1 Tax=Kribbella alba TaxID=190197 RepID=A0ABN2F0S2_9ACTN
MPSAGRTHPDRCPGVLAVHEAADGGLARVRLPGGVLSAEQLEALAAASAELGDGSLELTSRGNIQIRALCPGAPRELSDRLYDAGLLPSITHERVRNILASPLSGLDKHSLYDVLPAAAELDRLLCARQELAELPGRFLFALDDGRGDLAGVGADVAIRVLPAPNRATAPSTAGEALLVLGGGSSGVRVALADVAGVMTAAAEAFLEERAAQGSEAWRIAELEDGPARILARLAESEAADDDAGTSVRVVAGCHQQRDGRMALVATVPLGSLGQAQAAALVEVAGAGLGELRVTPWRSVVLGGLADTDDAVERLEAVGLVVEPDSPWNGVTACAGRPGCAKALADVRADARRVTPGLPAGRAVHWSGCERRCGRPAGEFIDVVAVRNGYSVDGAFQEDAVAAARRMRVQ